MRKLVLVAMAGLIAACSMMPQKTEPPRVNVVPVMRRNIEVYADAAGNIEPVSVVDVKSKAAGQIIRLLVETGSTVRAGDTLVQLDTKEVDQQVDQAVFDTVIANANYQNDLKERIRQDSLLAAKAITRKDHDAGALNVARSENNLAKARSAWEAAKQRQSEATVLAPINGTIITRSATDGMIVTSSTSGLSAGTTLMQMADLTQLRVKASFNETDIANIVEGMTATIKVDALADEDIPGRITKIEPLAVNQQSVTMFPVIISIDNSDGRLRPGMNGSISVWVDRRENVIAIPNEAIRATTETPFLAQVLESITGDTVNADSLKAVVDSQIDQLSRGGFQITQPAGDTPAAAPAGGGGGGDVDMSVPGFQAQQQQRGGQPGGRGGQTGGRGGRGMPTTEECAPIKAGLAKTAAVKKEYDDLIAKLRQPETDRIKTNADLRNVYTKARLDTALARRCQNLEPGMGGGGRGGQGGGRAGGMAGRGGGGGARGGGGGGAGFVGSGRTGPTRNALIFIVPEEGKYEARVVRLGLGSYEFTEVVEGLREGEQVALLGAAIIATQQQQARDRMKQNMGAGNALGAALGGGAAPRGGNMGGGGGGGNQGGRGGGRGG